MTESLLQSQERHIDFAVMQPIDEKRPTARFLNIFVGRSFPVEARGVISLERLEGDGGPIVRIDAETIRQRLIETADTEGLQDFEKNLKPMQVTGLFFPIEMGQFVDRDTDQLVSLSELASS